MSEETRRLFIGSSVSACMDSTDKRKGQSHEIYSLSLYLSLSGCFSGLSLGSAPLTLQLMKFHFA